MTIQGQIKSTNIYMLFVIHHTTLQCYYTANYTTEGHMFTYEHDVQTFTNSRTLESLTINNDKNSVGLVARGQFTNSCIYIYLPLYRSIYIFHYVSLYMYNLHVS